MYEDTIDKVVGKKTCMVIHENPNEGIINLDLPGDGDTPGLGVYHLRYTSEIVSSFDLLLRKDHELTMVL